MYIKIDDERLGNIGYFSAPVVADPVVETGQWLWTKALRGVHVGLYDATDAELTRRAVEWAAREEAMGLNAKKIAAAELKVGKAIADSGNIIKQLTGLGTALKAAVDAVPVPQGTSLVQGTGPHLIRTLALFTHGTNDWLGIGGDITTRSVATIIKGIAPVLSIDVKVVIYGCSAARGQKEASDWVVTTMEPGGADSLAAKIRDALVNEGKYWSSVWGHTEVGHTTRNPSLRIFYAVGGAGATGVSYASGFVFKADDKKLALAELEDTIKALGYTISDSKQESFKEAAYRGLRKLMYLACIKANIKKVTKGGKTFKVNNLTYKGVNLSEMAPLYPVEVADLIKKYWSDVYWTKALKDETAKKLIKTLKLKKS
jgi:hypothetical protein